MNTFSIQVVHFCLIGHIQVTQLAEDRGYLNTQLANLSKSLREKEQEWLAMRQQFGDLYQAYIGAQSKVQFRGKGFRAL